MSALRSILEAILAALSGSRRRTSSPPAPESAQSPRSEPKPAPRSEPESEPGEVIRNWVEAWRGVPYQMGGTDRSGIDCSGFVRAMYGEVFSCPLPRTSRKQAGEGREVSRQELRPGDLVFFKISDRTRHVGAYVGDGHFGHASTSQGPMVSSLESEYWTSRWWTARRVL